MIQVWTDGLCEPINPHGVGTYAYLIKLPDRKPMPMYGYIGEGEEMSNQVAEYIAVSEALEVLKVLKKQNEEIVLYTDSQLVANQMNGLWAIHRGIYLGAYFKTAKLKDEFKNLKFQWIPREENKEADRLSRQAYEEFMTSMKRKVKYAKREG